MLNNFLKKLEYGYIYDTPRLLGKHIINGIIIPYSYKYKFLLTDFGYLNCNFFLCSQRFELDYRLI